MASGYPCILSADDFNRSISADRMFTTNPVVGNWESEDATIALKIEKNDTIQVDITDIAGEYRCSP